MIGRCISYWNSPFLGDMLVFGGVSFRKPSIPKPLVGGFSPTHLKNMWKSNWIMKPQVSGIFHTFPSTTLVKPCLSHNKKLQARPGIFHFWCMFLQRFQFDTILKTWPSRFQLPSKLDSWKSYTELWRQFVAMWATVEKKPGSLTISMSHTGCLMTGSLCHGNNPYITRLDFIPYK